MTKERLQAIKDSIEFQMQIQQAVGYKSRYDDLLIEEIELYNEVVDLQQRIDKAIEYIEENKDKTIAPYGDNEDTDYETCLDKDEIKDLLEILKGESNNE